MSLYSPQEEILFCDCLHPFSVAITPEAEHLRNEEVGLGYQYSRPQSTSSSSHTSGEPQGTSESSRQHHTGERGQAREVISFNSRYSQSNQSNTMKSKPILSGNRASVTSPLKARQGQPENICHHILKRRKGRRQGFRVP